MGTPLKNPPVCFTIAQARFNPLLKLGDYLPSIQDAMRKAGFSDFTSRKAITVQIADQERPPTPPNVVSLDQYFFANAGKTHRFILNPDAFTFQSTRYRHFEEFSAQFLKGLAMVHEIVELDFTVLVGLRYFDHVAPRPNESIEQYVVPEVLGLDSPRGGTVAYSFSETFSYIDNVGLRSRVLIRNGQFAFPPDVIADGMEIEQRFLRNSGRHATLDTDGFVDGRIVFSEEAVRKHPGSIHDVISASFKSAATAHAFEAWNEK
ncbi:MAG: TIGR04255 family protein [Alphaproteobacteria bacterium]|nr:TIGR04255 family protein [Alphaproteobacteria bacterium]